MIETTQRTVFLFSTTVKDTTYNFQLFADSQQTARQELVLALRQIADELDAVKATSKAN